MWIDHGDGIVTRDAHLESVADLGVGDRLEAGAVVGAVGASGLARRAARTSTSRYASTISTSARTSRRTRSSTCSRAPSVRASFTASASFGYVRPVLRARRAASRSAVHQSPSFGLGGAVKTPISTPSSGRSYAHGSRSTLQV